jgi:hypothetical protein
MGGVCEALQGHGLSGVQSRTQLRSAAPERVHTCVHGPGRGSPERTHACMPDLEGASSVCVRHRQLTRSGRRSLCRWVRARLQGARGRLE